MDVTIKYRCAETDFSYKIPHISMTSFPFPSHAHSHLKKGNSHFFPSNNSQFPPIPIPIRQLSRDIWVFMKIFFWRAACLCWPPTNSVGQELISVCHPLNFVSCNDPYVGYATKLTQALFQVLASYSMQWVFSPHSEVLIPIPMHLNIPISIPFHFHPVANRIPIPVVGIPWDP